MGSPFYRAPEQVYCLPPYPTTYSTGVDIWSAGVVLYVLLGANLPFNESAIPRPPFSPAFTTAGAQPAKVLLNAHSFPKLQFGSVSEAAKAAINAMLVIDPRRRPSAAEMLRHPWLVEPEAFGRGGLPAEVDGLPGGPERSGAGSLATSYKESMRNLMRAAKRAREVDSERVRQNSVGAGSVGSSVFGSCSFRDGAAAMAMSRHGSAGQRDLHGMTLHKGNARKLHEPKAARRAPHGGPEEAVAVAEGAEAGLFTQAGFFRPFGTTDAVSVDAGSTSERDPPHPGVDVLDL